MMKDKKYRRGLQNMDVDKEEKQPISIKKILESNEMDYEKFEDIYDPILETELTTEDGPINKILDWFSQNFNKPRSFNQFWQSQTKLQPVGSTVRYEVMKLCTGLVLDSNGWYLAVLSH